jgi:hypothetical protein
MTRFDDIAPRVLEAVRGGATVDEAAKLAEIPVKTVHSWATRGRKDAEGRYGAFARDLDATRAARRLPTSADRGALTREEWEACVAQAVRAGNVQAMKLWADTHGAEGDGDDPFAEFDPPGYR